MPWIMEETQFCEVFTDSEYLLPVSESASGWVENGKGVGDRIIEP